MTPERAVAIRCCGPFLLPFSNLPSPRPRPVFFPFRGDFYAVGIAIIPRTSPRKFSPSRRPVVHMVPRGQNAVCPFLEDGLCSIHDCKPTVCALFPLGRVVVHKTALERGSENNSPEIEFEVKYMLNDIDCGSRKHINTVREWLARFGIPAQDEFFLMWSKLTIKLHAMISELEKRHVSNETLNMFGAQSLLRCIWITIPPTNSFPSFDRQRRNCLRCAREVRRILRLYYRYLATGQVAFSKNREISINKTYDWAIKTLYFSAKRSCLDWHRPIRG